MLPAARALSSRGSAGECLPDVFPQLLKEGIRFRRSQLSMIVAGPGVGKSVFAMVFAAKAKVRTLFHSADTDPYTANVRLASTVTGDRQEDVDDALSAGNGDVYVAAVDGLVGLQFSFDSSPSVDDIIGEVDAYALVYGDYPELIVIDNLMNLYAEGDNEYQAFRVMLDELHQLARLTAAHVMVLHHAIGEYDDGNIPIPTSGINGKVSKIPELILSLYRIHDDYTDSLGVCCIKQRNGQADASAKTPIFFRVDLSRMKLDAVPDVVWSPSRMAVE